MLEGPQASSICPSVKSNFQDEYESLKRRMIQTGQSRLTPTRSPKYEALTAVTIKVTIVCDVSLCSSVDRCRWKLLFPYLNCLTQKLYIHNTHTHTHTHIYIYMCVCVCVRACEWVSEWVSVRKVKFWVFLMSHRACCHTCYTIQLMHYSHFKTQSLQHLKPIKC